MRRPRSPGLRTNLLVLGTCLLALMMYSNWSAFINGSAVVVNEHVTLQHGPFSLIQSDDFPQSSSAHCSLSTMNEIAWKFNQCSFKNLCYFNHKFEFYQLLGDVMPLPEPLTLSDKHDGEPFLPLVKPNQPLPTPRLQPNADKDDVWVMIGEVDQTHGLERFLRDGVFAWWLLGQHAVWDKTNAVLRPLTVGVVKLTPQHQEWFQAVFSEAGRLMTTEVDLNELPAPVCFPRSVAGLGAMTDHCHAPEDHQFHRQQVMQMHIAVESVPCSTGRGALFFELRELILTNLKLSSTSTAAEHPKFVLLSSEFAHLAERIATELNVPIKVQQQGEPQQKLSDVATLFLNAAVFVTRSFGDHTVGAMFMPPGAGLVLVQQKPVYTNFAYWNNLAYLRAAWISDDDSVMKQIAIEWERSKELIK